MEAENIFKFCLNKMNGGMDHQNLLNVLSALCEVANNLPIDSQYQCLKVIYTPFANNISEFLSSQKPESITRVQESIQSLATILVCNCEEMQSKMKNGMHPILSLFTDLNPLLVNFVTKYHKSNPIIIGSYSELVTNVVNSTGQSFFPLVESTLQFVLICFKETLEPSLLQIIFNLIRLFFRLSFRILAQLFLLQEISKGRLLISQKYCPS